MFVFLFLPVLIGFSSSVLFGTVPKRSEISSQVTIFAKFRGGNEVICGGVLISLVRVLTAAHCVQNAESVEVQEIGGPSYWTNNIQILRNDRAILTLNYLLHYTEIAKLSPIPNTAGMICYAAGRGIDENNNYPDFPRKIEITFKFKGRETRAFPISSSRRGKRSHFCMGDSGSPVYCRVNDRTALIGVLSMIGIEKREATNETKAQIFGAKTQAQKCAHFRYATVSTVPWNFE